jgi:[acyl-carrier-protein] S-malonyltransferase
MSNTVANHVGIIFPGQNSQHVGMLAEIAQAYPVVELTFAEASQVLGYDLWQLVQNGPAEQLALTSITQPALLASSVALWRVWQQLQGAAPSLLAGHSLGEYSALVCAEVIDFAEAIALVRKRGELMQSAVPVGVGAMAAILSLEDDVIAKCCAAASTDSEIVVPANFNSVGQVVISGHAAAVERAIILCKEAGAKRAMLLTVSAPFHSPLMKPAAQEFAKVIAQIKLSPPKIPVMQNVGLQLSNDSELIRQNLIAQIANPVPWVATMQAFAERGVTKLVELGPGKVLAGLNKRIDSRLDTLSVNDPVSLQQALSQIGAE